MQEQPHKNSWGWIKFPTCHRYSPEESCLQYVQRNYDETGSQGRCLKIDFVQKSYNWWKQDCAGSSRKIEKRAGGSQETMSWAAAPPKALILNGVQRCTKLCLGFSRIEVMGYFSLKSKISKVGFFWEMLLHSIGSFSLLWTAVQRIQAHPSCPGVSELSKVNLCDFNCLLHVISVE